MLALQGPEPAHSAMLAGYMRHLLKPHHGKPVEEPAQEASQPESPTELSIDDQVKASSWDYGCCCTLLAASALKYF